MKAGLLAGTLVMGSIVLALAAGQAPAGRLTFPGTNGRLAYGFNGSIVTIDPDGTNKTVVIAGSTGLPSAEPAWSADGTRIAFVATAGPTPGIWWATPDGKTRTRVTQHQNDKSPTWSPDGTKIAFSRYGPGVYEIFVMNADGTNAVNRSNGGGLDACWSPDGKKIAFTSIRATGRGFRLYVMDADGGNVTELSGNDNGIGNVYPEWSPDCRRIAFTDQVDGVLQIAVCDADGKNLKTMTATGSNAFARWSPDGKSIVFSRSVENQPPALWIMDAGGENQRELLRGNTWAVWQPKAK